MNEKHCPGCDQIKPVSEFYRETGCQTYRRLCKRCFNRDLRTKYKRKYETGWSIDQYEEQRAIQESRCAICGEHESSLPVALAGDHDHLTLTRRGLLCARGNRGIGVFEDSPELLRQAADYLDRHAQAHPQIVDAR